MTEPNDREEWIAAQVARAPVGLVDSLMDHIAPMIVDALTERASRGELPPPRRRRHRAA